MKELIPYWPVLESILHQLNQTQNKKISVRMLSGLPYLCLRLALRGQSLFVICSENRAETLRDDCQSLSGFFDSLKEELEVTEKVLREDIISVSKSLKREGEKLLVFPASCVACDYRFGTKRPKPSRCPNCKGQRIRSASYKLRGQR